MKEDYSCNFGTCTKHFKTKFSLKRHYLAHMGVKLYKCTICFKHFSLAQHLNEHVYTHTGEKPYICYFPGCNKRFRQAGKLSFHKKKHNSDQKFKIATKSVRKTNSQSFKSINLKETLFDNIASFQLPTFFYTKTLPMPYSFANPFMVVRDLNQWAFTCSRKNSDNQFVL